LAINLIKIFTQLNDERKIMQKINIKKDWEFNTLEIYNYNKSGPYDLYFNFIKDNANYLDGDIIEAGVFRGRTLLSVGILLAEMGSDKKIYGFDSFSGFPPIYEPQDEINAFKKLFDSKMISKDHFEAVQKNLYFKNVLIDLKTNSSSISKSGDFSNTNKADLLKKIDLLGLKNIILVEGPFSTTMIPENAPKNIFAAMIDCDLYSSYLQTFGFIWPNLIKDGICQLDEYYSLKFPGARIATNEFLKNCNHELIMSPLNEHDEFERWAVKKLS